MNDDARAHLQELIWAGTMAQAVCAAVQLGLPEALADGPQDLDTLAEQCQAHPGSLSRLLRALASAGVLTRGGDAWALAPPGQELLVKEVDGRSLAGMAAFLGGPWLAGPRAAMADAVRSGEGAFPLAHGTDVYAYMEKHAEAARAYERWNGYAAGVDQQADAVIDVYDFSRARHIVDVGGRYGTLLARILQRNPNLQATLLDLPTAVADAPRILGAAGVADRCRIVAGSLFDGVPADGDVYLLGRVLVDWDDEHAARILRLVREAMGPSSRLVVVETVLDEATLETPYASTYNLSLMLYAGALRTEDEHQTLLEGAGLRLRRLLPTASVVTTLIEAEPA